MKILDLEQQEKIAFGCLVRMMIRSDGHFSAEEDELVERIGIEELGEGHSFPGDGSGCAWAWVFDAVVQSSEP